MLYRSKIDTWALLLLALLPSVPVGLALLTHAPIAYFAFSAILLIYVLFLLPTTYRLAETELEIRFGLMRKRIPYTEIHSATLTRSPYASPALSFDRIAIGFGPAAAPRDQILISPQNRTAFLVDLGARIPHLRVSATS